jgi:hypothetical protein
MHCPRHCPRFADRPCSRSKWSENAMNIIDAQVHIWSQTVVPTSGLHRKNA